MNGNKESIDGIVKFLNEGGCNPNTGLCPAVSAAIQCLGHEIIKYATIEIVVKIMTMLIKCTMLKKCEKYKIGQSVRAY